MSQSRRVLRRLFRCDAGLRQLPFLQLLERFRIGEIQPRVRDLILLQGDWGAGAALNFLLLAITLVFSWIAYRFAKLNRIDA